MISEVFFQLTFNSFFLTTLANNSFVIHPSFPPIASFRLTYLLLSYFIASAGLHCPHTALLSSSNLNFFSILPYPPISSPIPPTPYQPYPPILHYLPLPPILHYNPLSSPLLPSPILPYPPISSPILVFTVLI